MQIFVSKPNIIGSDNGLSSGRRLAIIWKFHLHNVNDFTEATIQPPALHN